MAGVPLTNEVIYKLNDEQRAILEELADIAAKELNLSEIISEVGQRVRETYKVMGFDQKTSEPQSLAEDPEVEILITSKPRYKIENVREQIRRTLLKAVELDLGFLALIQRQCKNYGVPLDPKKTKVN